VRATLARVVTPVCPNNLDDVAALDDVIQALVDPRMLHHPAQRVQGLALACLREALRVCRLDDSDADAGDGDADESGGARVERCTSARDSPLMPSDESLSPYTSSSSAELSLSARRGPQDSALQAMVRLSPSAALLRLYRDVVADYRYSRSSSFVTPQVQRSGAAELNLKPERTRLVFGESWLRGSTEMHQAIRYAQTHSSLRRYD
jgi:hypothetical protein